MPGVLKQAFQSALLQGVSNLDDVIDIKEEGENFQKRLKPLIPNNLTNATLVAGIVVASAAAIASAYILIANRIEKVDDEREEFLDAVAQNIASFFIPDSVDKQFGSVKCVAEFIKRLEKNNILNKFSHLLSKKIDKSDKKGRYYHIFSVASLPFAAHLVQPREDGDNVDEAIQMINIFLGGEFKELLEKVNSQVDRNCINNAKLFVNAKGHIENLNATRLIAIALANISFNLVQGVNPNNNSLLTLDESRSLCEEFRSLLLNEICRFNDAHSIYTKLVAADKLGIFFEKLEARINILQNAYKGKLENDLNLSDVINGGYAVLQNTTRVIRRMLFNELDIDYTVIFFSKLIDLSIEINRDPNLLERLIKKLEMKRDYDFTSMQLNQIPSTVLDFMAIYASHYRDVRAKALKNFKRETDKDLVEILRYLDTNYIMCIEDANKTYGVFGECNKQFNPAREYLICFISLMIEAHNITFLEQTQDGKCSNDQAVQFLKHAFAENAYYEFKYILAKDLKSFIQEYLTKQIDLILAIRQLSLVTTLIEINPSFLIEQEFQKSLKDKLCKLQKLLKDFTLSKHNLIDYAAQNAITNNNITRLIISEINQNVPDRYTNLPDLCDNLAKDVDRAINQINNPKFKNNSASKQEVLLNKIEFYSLDRDIISYQDLRELNIHNHDGSLNSNMSDNYSDNATIASTGSNSLIIAWRFKLLNIVFIVSSVLLVVGLAFLLMSTYGISSSVVVANALLGVQGELMITGFSSVGAGGLGLGSSYILSKFFNKNSVIVPFNEVKPSL